MNLSIHDKNMLATSWLIEVLLNSLVQQDNKNVPESKKEAYDELQVNFATALGIISDVNESISQNIMPVFGQQFMDELSDLTTISAVMFRTIPTDKLLQYMKVMGMHNIVKAKEELKTLEVKQEEVAQEVKTEE